jgi:hypothetical protein
MRVRPPRWWNRDDFHLDDPSNVGRAAAESARCAAAAAAWKAASMEPVARGRIEEMFADTDGARVEAAIGLATEAGFLDLLVRAARDESLGSLRMAAVDGASRVGPKDTAVIELIRQASRGEDPFLRAQAARLITLVGDEPMETALRRAREGDVDDEALEQIGARAVATGVTAAVLRDASLPKVLLRSTLLRLPQDWIQDPQLPALVAVIAERCNDVAVREIARRRLQETHPGDARGVQIVSATYGIDTRTIDVLEEVRARLTHGRAVFKVWSDLGEDPAVGVTKTLRVELTLGGRRFVRTARDAEWMTIP